MAPLTPRPGDGQFQWNTGAWFGGQFGCTAWLLPGAAVIATRAPGMAALWVACWLVPNALGLALWRRRDRIRPYPAMQALLLTAGLGAQVALLGAWRWVPEAGAGLGLRPRDLAMIPAGVGTMMLWFSLLDRAGRRRPGPADSIEP